VLGTSFRADVTTTGTIVPWDGSPPLAWYIAADDRWHSPDREVAVRQSRLRGAPVFETRVRIPGGDAVQRIWSVADGGGRTLVEVTNDSPLPIACAFTRNDVLTVRPPADVPIQGIELPPTTIVLPVGHRASVTIALAHGGGGPGTLPPGSASADATARGWVARSEAASRVVLPDERVADRLVAARAELLLAGPPAADDDPVGFLLGVAELVRLRELGSDDLDDIVPDVAGAVAAVARESGWDVDAALAAAAPVLAAAGEERALRDLARILASRPAAAPPPSTPADGVRDVAAIERLLVRDGALLPDGVPPAWRGANLEAHRLSAGPRSTVSFAVRWHGEHPAVLWELDGDPVELRAPVMDPDWRTTEPRGETLWRRRR